MNKAVVVFSLGDVVREIGETQKMTVDVVKPGRVQTCWFDEADDYQRGEFDAKDLELVPPDELEDDEEDDEGEDESGPDFEDDFAGSVGYPEDEDWDDEDDFEDEDLEDEEDDLEIAETPASGIATEPVVEA